MRIAAAAAASLRRSGLFANVVQANSDAQAQASGMIRRAESEIEQERVKAFSEVKKELSGMAVDIASQMVGREIKPDDQDSLVDEFIRNAGDRA